DGALAIAQGGREIALDPGDLSQISEYNRLRRLKRNTAAIELRGLLEAAGLSERDGEIGVGLGVVGLEGDGLAEVGDCGLDLAQAAESHTQVAVRFRSAGTGGDRLAQQVSGAGVPAALQLDHAQQLQRARMRGLAG